MGVSDANPTTILEAMAWGLPIICTPQSGYYCRDEVFTVELDDIEGNMSVIRELEEIPESDLMRAADRNRERVATYYTWHRFCTSIDRIIQDAVVRRSRATLAQL